jgi:hypothetical protein
LQAYKTLRETLMRTPHALLATCAAIATLLAACGGGGGATSLTTSAPTGTAGGTSGGAAGGSSGTVSASGAAAGATSSGAITAFGSVFVNGHEFATDKASVIDDDTGTSTPSTAALEVGMTVDVTADSSSTPTAPVAKEVHARPLARGYVDASDTTNSTLTVMGQSVRLSASTVFVDRRACITSTTPCTPISGQAGLTATSGTGGSAVAGNFVGVHGTLFASGTPTSTAIVASLVVVGDAPSSGVAAYKAEGVVTAVGTSSVTIGGLTVNLGSAICTANAATTPCATAFSVGSTVSAFAAAAPSLPASTFTADKARLVKKLVVETAGATVEMEGKVSSVSSAGAALFVIRGVTIDATGLPAGTTLPAVGDEVKVVGTVSTDGTKIAATALTVLHADHALTYGFESDFSAIADGASARTYVLTLVGQTINVDATTRLADHSQSHSGPTSTPFNIGSFKTYLTASASKHLMVRTSADNSGKLTALSIEVMPPRAVVAVAGVIDASPVPVNGSGTGAGATPTTFSVHGVPISASAAAVVRKLRGAGTTAAAGDMVLVRGTYASGTLTVAAPTGTTPSELQIVIDRGVPTGGDEDCF